MELAAGPNISTKYATVLRPFLAFSEAVKHTRVVITKKQRKEQVALVGSTPGPGRLAR